MILLAALAALLQEPAPADERERLVALEARVAELVEERAGLLERIASLEGELAAHERWREARTREWLGFTRALAQLELPTRVEPPAHVRELLREEDQARPDEPQPDPGARALERRAERGRELRRDLSALLLAEYVFDIEVLELGLPSAGWTGPVVLRLIDERGRPVGNLAADRLRLEASRAGRTVTLVLEQGRELLHGRVRPFGEGLTGDGAGDPRGGVRRIELLDVDPAPWIEALPELFDPARVEPLVDDGTFDRDRVRLDLNALLQDHSAGGHWRLQALGGVQAGVLRDVRVVQLDGAGAVLRRLFADRLRIELEPGAARLVLEDGVQERDGSSAPFLEGRYRIVLPGVDPDAWRSAGLPGIAAQGAR